jgi:hypothetical protein
MAEEKKKRFTHKIKCGHCQNEAPMEIVAEHSDVESHEDRDVYWDAGMVYEVCKCPACSGVAFRRYFYHDAMDPSDLE